MVLDFDGPFMTIRYDFHVHQRKLLIIKGVGRTGFEPVKAKPEDLQSSPVGHLGICPVLLSRNRYRLLQSIFGGVLASHQK